MTARRNRELQERFIQVLNEGRLDALREFLAPDYKLHGAGVEIEGAEAFRIYVEAVLSVFADLVREVEEIIVTEDRVVTRWRGIARHTGEFQGVLPTNREVHITGIVISHVEDGRIVEEWEQVDRLGLLEQVRGQ